MGNARPNPRRRNHETIPTISSKISPTLPKKVLHIKPCDTRTNVGVLAQSGATSSVEMAHQRTTLKRVYSNGAQLKAHKASAILRAKGRV